MQSENPFLSDLSRLCASTLGLAGGVKAELEARFRQRFEQLLRDMDLVTREEFEVVRALALKAREQQEALAARLRSLEARLAGERPPAASPADGKSKTR